MRERVLDMGKFAIDRRFDLRNEFVRCERAAGRDRRRYCGLFRSFWMIEGAARLPSVFLTEVEERGALDAKHRRDLLDGNGAGVVDESCLLDEFRRQDDLAKSHAGICLKNARLVGGAARAFMEHAASLQDERPSVKDYFLKASIKAARGFVAR